jgi:hypothetical protein
MFLIYLTGSVPLGDSSARDVGAAKNELRTTSGYSGGNPLWACNISKIRVLLNRGAVYASLCIFALKFAPLHRLISNELYRSGSLRPLRQRS